MKACNKCGFKAEDDARFCTSCGADISEVPAGSAEGGGAGVMSIFLKYAAVLNDAQLYKVALAKEMGFDYFTTTLSISPHKNAQKLNEIGEALERELGIKYLYADFKKKEGYKRSIRLSEEYGLYRQNYCGCIYSKKNN